jgi:hypothetical protein
LNLFDFLNFLWREHLELDLLDLGLGILLLLRRVSIESYFLNRGFLQRRICLKSNLLNLFFFRGWSL